MSDPGSPTILQRYRLLRKIATGGMAEVYLAEQTGAGGFKKRVAIKRILPAFAEDPKFVEMFLDEARLAAMFHHPNLIQIYELGEVDGLLCLIMEYVRGISLADLNKRAHAAGRTAVPPEIAARIVAQACEGLQYAHDFADPDTGERLGLVHRDVSPQNILISTEGIVKVMDFGIAKAAGQIHHTSTGTLKGKLAYMPPEQLDGKSLDRRADIWALGVVLYELLAGRRPFVGDSEASVFRAILMEPPKPMVELIPGIPPQLQAVVTGALTKELDRRTPTAGAMSQQLEDWLQTGARTGQAEVAAWIKPLLPAPEQSGAASPAAPTLTPSNLSHAPPAGTTLVDEPQEQTSAAEVPGGPPASTGSPGRSPAALQSPLLWMGVAAAAVVVALGFGIVTWLSPPSRELPRREVAAPATTALPIAAAPAPQAPVAVPPPAPAPSPALAAVRPADPPLPAPARPPPPAVKPSARTDRHHRRGPTEASPASPAKPLATAPDTSGPMGSLVVNTEPWSRVTIDGRDFGQTPLPGVALKPGRHEMVCTNPDSGLVHRETVVIPPGQRVKRFINLAGGE